MRFSLKHSQLGLRNSTTRIPFRYGNACMTRCPQAVLGVVIEDGGRTHAGFSGDCLPPGWFDKTPDKDYRQQIAEMLASIGTAQRRFAEAFAQPTTFFPAWRSAHDAVQAAGCEQGMSPLLASFGASLVERAIIDAVARAADVTFFEALTSNLLAIEPGLVHARLAGCAPADWLPNAPRRSVFVRHTVGLSDPITAADIPADQRLGDGLPQSLEEYLTGTGTRYFKIKVCNQLDNDLPRLQTIASVIQRVRGPDYHVTLDGNEQYRTAEQFAALVDAIEHTESLRQLWANTICVEQPLERTVALSEAHTAGIRDLGRRKPVIIDESDGELGSFPRAIELGYRGVSSKSCKGAIKSLLNAGIIWLLNERGQRSDYLMTAEDLCTVGIIPVQQDLCLVAALGLTHVERNGHHFHRGLSYLPTSQQEAALARHGDLYERHGEFVAPRVVDGCFQIGSLQCPGFGFDVLPDWRTMQSPEQWTYESLELA